MKRRSFLAFLGLAPATSIVAKELLKERPTPQPAAPPPPGTGRLFAHGRGFYAWEPGESRTLLYDPDENVWKAIPLDEYNAVAIFNNKEAWLKKL